MKKFWYVSRDPATVGYHDPKQAFFSKEEAKKQAESLCKKHGHDFYVMESVEMVKQSAPPIEWIKVPAVSDSYYNKDSKETWTYLGTTNRRYDSNTGRYRDAKGRFTY